MGVGTPTRTLSIFFGFPLMGAPIWGGHMGAPHMKAPHMGMGAIWAFSALFRTKTNGF